MFDVEKIKNDIYKAFTGNDLSVYFDKLVKESLDKAQIDYFKERLQDAIDYFTLDGTTFYRVYFLGPMTADDVASLTLGDIDEIINIHLRGESFIDRLEEIIDEANRFGADVADYSIYDDICVINIRFKDQEIKEVLTLAHYNTK